MKKVLLLAVVLLISGLSFAQTKSLSPLPKPFANHYEENGYSVSDFVSFNSKDSTSEKSKSFFLSVKSWLVAVGHSEMAKNLTYNGALYLANHSVKEYVEWTVENRTFEINGVKNNLVDTINPRPSYSDRNNKIKGPEPCFVLDLVKFYQDEYKITIADCPKMVIGIARCLNTTIPRTFISAIKPVLLLPDPVVQQVQNQQMSHDTTIVNITMELPANFGNSNVVQTQQIQQTQPKIIYVDDFGNTINPNSCGSNYYETPIRHINSFMDASSNVGQQYGVSNGSAWNSGSGYPNNQNYNYNNAGFSNTASWNSASAGASFTITGSATTVLVASNGSLFGWYDSNGHYHGKSFVGQTQNNYYYNNGGMNQNENNRIAENMNAKPNDGSHW